MKKEFSFYHQVRIYFGRGEVDNLSRLLNEFGFKRAIVICDPFFKDKALQMAKKEKKIKAVFSDIKPDPQLADITTAMQVEQTINADVVIALGGGSAIDSAKFVAALKYSSFDIQEYYYQKRSFSYTRIPVIAIPTTAGTGSEVTQVAVINHNDEKRTISDKAFLPFACIVDSSLTLTVPPKMTMICGLDALSHALEGYWSVHNQPICDLYSKESVKLIMENLETAFDNGKDIEARDNMSYASLLAGLSFAQTKTAAVHACSYPLSIDYGMPHGEACAFTLDKFIEINADERLEELSRYAGFSNPLEMTDEIKRLKKKAELKTTLKDAGVEDIEGLAKKCLNQPLIKNNPKKITLDILIKLFEGLR